MCLLVSVHINNTHVATTYHRPKARIWRLLEAPQGRADARPLVFLSEDGWSSPEPQSLEINSFPYRDCLEKYMCVRMYMFMRVSKGLILLN